MKVGDILTGPDLDRLPIGSVAVFDGPPSPFFNAVIRQADGFSWVSDDGAKHEHCERILACEWKLVHLAGPIVPRVGEVIETEEQAKALPVGAVIVAVEAWDPGSDPAIKIGPGRWLYSDGSGNEGVVEGDDLMCAPHKVIHIPDADAGPGRTAA